VLSDTEGKRNIESERAEALMTSDMTSHIIWISVSLEVPVLGKSELLFDMVKR
jgi:hypothetical protein